MRAGGQGERPLAAVGFQHREAIALQIVAHQLAQLGLVVDDEHGPGHDHPFSELLRRQREPTAVACRPMSSTARGYRAGSGCGSWSLPADLRQRGKQSRHTTPSWILHRAPLTFVCVPPYAV